MTRSSSLGIGIHAGTALVGNIGSDKHLDYSVIGETVNLAGAAMRLRRSDGDCGLGTNRRSCALPGAFTIHRAVHGNRARCQRSNNGI